ncbi:MAG: gephyrin-like molybdotransferase Glp [Nitriliruptorales bacterium]
MGRTEVTPADELEAVDVYRDRILSELTAIEPVLLDLGDALGLVLAEDVRAQEQLPPFTNSAMDGYAVVGSALTGGDAQRPVRLRLVGEVAAGGEAPPAVQPGEAVRIMTGAPLPPGADTVVPVELTRESDGEVAIFRACPVGANVRPSGEDVRVGQLVLSAGRRLRPGDIALLAALGRARVRCHPRPRVVVFSTGSELVAHDQPLAPGKIRDSNGPMLSALVRQAEAIPFAPGIVPDDRDSLLRAFSSHLGQADLLLASGGVSAGAHDHVRDVLGELGEVRVRKIAMKPGMPQVWGQVKGVPVFGLPGNPVSSFVSFEVFVRPALRRLQGRNDLFPPDITARMGEDVHSPAAKRSYLRVRLSQQAGEWTASLSGGQGSHVIGGLVDADGLAEIPEERTTVRAGEAVRVQLLVGN